MHTLIRWPLEHVLACLRDASPSVRVRTARALRERCSDGRSLDYGLSEALVDIALVDPDAVVRTEAVHALHEACRRHGYQVPSLVKELARDECDEVRLVVAAILGEHEDRGHVTILEDLLRDEVASVRAEAAASLRRHEDTAGPAVPELIRLMREDQTPDVRRAAAEALMGHSGAERDLCVAARADTEESVRVECLRSLEPAVAAEVGEAINAAITSLADECSAVRCMAAVTLGYAPHAGAQRALARLLREEPEWSVRAAAAESLGMSREPWALRIIEELAVLDRHPLVRGRAAEALGRYAGERSGAVLCDRLQTDPDPRVRASCALALAYRASPASLKTLDRAVRREPANASFMGALCRASANAAWPEALAVLVEVLLSPDADPVARADAATALLPNDTLMRLRHGAFPRRMQPQAVAHVLDEAVTGDDRLISIVVRNLRGLRDPVHVPVLAELLNSANADLRAAAATALRELAPAARAAIPALSNKLRDRDRAVRRAVRKALERLTQDRTGDNAGRARSEPDSQHRNTRE